MGMMWTYAAVFLFVAKTLGEETGTNQNSSVNSTTSPLPKVYERRTLYFNSGSEVNLTCSDRPWSEIIYVIWEVTFKGCKIALLHNGSSVDSCKDDKSLRNSSNFQPYLHIPELSHEDEGVYECQSPFNGGNNHVVINLTLTVPPKVSMWLENTDNRTEAVCKAEEGKPAANISWTYAGNLLSSETQDSKGFFTVESRLVLTEGMDQENLKCVVKHPSWKEKRIVSEPTTGQSDGAHVPWLYILISVVITLVLAGFVLFSLKKLRLLNHCKQTVPPSSKSPPVEDVEEVQPYASYVQRVNSIYNSSADLFT